MMENINKQIVEDSGRWFEGYVQAFKSDDADLRQNVELKEEHTKRVCEEILYIGKKLGLSGKNLYLAEIMALFHDIGRFEQYKDYRTFSDQKSANHAELGVKVLRENGVLNKFDKPTQNLILKAILYHNRAVLPSKETKLCLFFSKLLRDADKLDIWRVVIDYYYRKNRKRSNAIELGLPNTPGISDDVYKDLMEKRIVNFKHLKNLNDFKLLQVGWIYDINFKPTFQRIKERDYLKMIYNVLPESQKIKGIFDMAQLYLMGKTRNVV